MTAVPAPLRVLFVCTANICRSAYAELRSRTLWPAAGVVTASAGVRGLIDRPIDPVMAAELARRGGDPAEASRFVSRPVTGEHLAWADLVLTFEFAHHMWLAEQAPWSAAKVFGVVQFARAAPTAGTVSVATLPRVRDAAGSNSMVDDVDDPYRRGRRRARVCADRIDAVLRSIATALPG